jgi:uncharacterized LabA/DUF88 family protein
MASSENISMAVFCDFENVALGVRDMNFDKFDIKPILERLLLKGSIVVKKAYCDWDRYKPFKATMHEANFELIEIPHVRQSGKNSADIRLVVDALDLCYTKSHVNTFVIVSGDSDFSPLVSKLRENAKRVIGVGVKQSTSDLLVANCDEFIFYDDLVREVRRVAAKRDERKAQPAPSNRRPAEGDNKKREEMEARKLQALEMVVETFDALISERGDTGKIWASLLKDTLKRRRPDFSESYYGFRTFGNLLEEAEKHGLFEFGRDEKSGTYVYRTSQSQSLDALGAMTDAEGAPSVLELTAPDAADDDADADADSDVDGNVALAPEAATGREPRRRGGRGRKSRDQQGAETQQAASQAEMAAPAPVADNASDDVPEDDSRRRGGRGRKSSYRQAAETQQTASQPDAVAREVVPADVPDVPADAPAAAPADEPRRRGGRGRNSRDRQGAETRQAASQSAAVAPEDVPEDTGLAAWPAPTPDLVEAAGSEPGVTLPGADEPAADAAKERRRAPRAPRKPAARKGAAAPAGTDAASVDADAVLAPDAAAQAQAPAPTGDAARVADMPAGAADASSASDAGSDDAGEDDKDDRKKSTRPAHKAPSRKPAARSRRPAKPKSPSDNG